MKIGLLQGNGLDLVGGGSIQLEYDLWGQSNEDIEIVHLLHQEDKETMYFDEIKELGRVLHNVRTFNSKTFDYKLLEDLDKLIVLTYPFLSNSPEYDKQISKIYFNVLSEYKNNKQSNSLYVICYDYLKEVVLNNLGYIEPRLFTLADRIWVNNSKNPLIEFIEKCSENENNIKNKFYIECPQFMNDTKLEWKDLKNKKNFLYYQGRSLDWKGWKELPLLSEQLKINKYSIPIIFNGITDIEEVNKYDKTFNTNKSNKDRFEFNNLFETLQNKESYNDLEFYGYYSPETANEITSSAMFSLYYTNLDPRQNFFPEYAMIDAIRNGTILIVPDWYFDGKKYYKEIEYNIIDKKPEEVGFLTWNKNSGVEELIKNIKELTSSKKLYNEYRTKAFNFMIDELSANTKIRKFLEL